MQSNSPPSRNVLVFGSGMLLSVFGFILGGLIGSGIGFVIGLTIGERYYLCEKSQNELRNRIEKLENKVEDMQESNSN